MSNLIFSAIYKDGKKVMLSDENPYDKLDRKNILFMEVKKLNDTPFLLMKLDDDVKLIYRRRVEKTVGMEEQVVYLLGWHKDGFQTINYINEDGRIIQGGKFDENDKWMYAPKFREFEV